MLELNPQSHNFKVTLPNNLIPSDVYKVFDDELLAKVNGTHDSIVEYIHESVQSVSIGDFEVSSYSETSHNSSRNLVRQVDRIADITDTLITVEFRTSNALANYLICLYSFVLRKMNSEYVEYVGDLFITIKDEGYGFTYRLIFKKCDWVGCSGITLNHNAELIEYRTFSLTFAFNDLSMDFYVGDDDSTSIINGIDEG